MTGQQGGGGYHIDIERPYTGAGADPNAALGNRRCLTRRRRTGSSQIGVDGSSAPDRAERDQLHRRPEHERTLSISPLVFLGEGVAQRALRSNVEAVGARAQQLESEPR